MHKLHTKLFCRKLGDDVRRWRVWRLWGPKMWNSSLLLLGNGWCHHFWTINLVKIGEKSKICIVRTWAATLLIVQRAKFWLVCPLTSSLISRKALIEGEVLFNCAECPHPDKPPTDETVCVDPATIACWPELCRSRANLQYITILHDICLWISDWKRSHETSFVICGRQCHQLFEISVLRGSVPRYFSPCELSCRQIMLGVFYSVKKVFGLNYPVDKQRLVLIIMQKKKCLVKLSNIHRWWVWLLWRPPM